VQKIDATGNVRIVQQNRTGFASHAVYDSRIGQIILTGTPHVTQGSDSISGKIITYFVDEDKSVVSGGGDSRVEAIINPPDRKGNADRR
jgi:lipopolysaccharide export system protein LptA